MERGSGSPEPADRIDAYLDGEHQRVPLYERSALRAGHAFDGPAVVAQADSTVCIPRGFAATVDDHGNILLRSDSKGGQGGA